MSPSSESNVCVASDKSPTKRQQHSPLTSSPHQPIYPSDAISMGYQGGGVVQHADASLPVPCRRAGSGHMRPLSTSSADFQVNRSCKRQGEAVSPIHMNPIWNRQRLLMAAVIGALLLCYAGVLAGVVRVWS